MFSRVMQPLKFIIYVFLGIFWGYKYFNLNDVLDEINNKLSDPNLCPISPDSICRLRWIDFIFGLNDVEAFFNTSLIQKIITFDRVSEIKTLESYYQVLGLTLKEGQKLRYATNDHVYITGVQKIDNKICFLIKQADANHALLKRLTFDNDITYKILTYWHVQSLMNECTMDLAQKNDGYQAWIKTGNDIEKSLIKIHQSRWFMQLEPSSNRLLDWFRLAHNDFYISEQLKLKSQWIDPWLYMHNTAYKVSIDTVFRMLNCDQHPLKHLLMQWSKQWFDETKVTCLDWSDVMIFDPKVNNEIFKQWPLLKSFNEIFKHNHFVIEAWNQFEQNFIKTNLADYHHLSLSFWRAKVFMYLCVMNEDRELRLMYLKSLPNKEQSTLMYDQVQLKDTTWSFQNDLTLVKNPAGVLKTSHILKHLIHGADYFTKHADIPIWLYLLRIGSYDVFQLCLMFSLSLDRKDIYDIKLKLPNKLKKDYFDFIYQQMITKGFALQHFIWLYDEGVYAKAIGDGVMTNIYALSEHIVPEMFIHQSVKKQFQAHQQKVYGSWLSKDASDFDKHIDWLKQIHIDGYITLPRLKTFVDNIIMAYHIKNAKLTLKQMKSLNELNHWVETNPFVVDHVFEFKKDVTEVLCKIIKKSYQQRSLSHTLLSEPLTQSLKQLIQPKDLPFIELMFKHYSCIDHWLDSMYLILFNALCQTNQPFLINPLIYWLYQTKIINIEDNQTCMLNQLFNVYQARKKHLLPSLQRYIDHMHTLCSTDEPCWDTLEVIVYKQRKEETNGNRAIQKEHRCGL